MNILTRGTTQIQPCRLSLGLRKGVQAPGACCAISVCHSFKYVIRRDCHDSRRGCWYEGRTTGVCLGASRMGNHVLPGELRRKAVTCGVQCVRRCPIGHDAFNAQSETGLHVLLIYVNWGTLHARLYADSIIEKGPATERKSEAD